MKSSLKTTKDTKDTKDIEVIKEVISSVLPLKFEQELFSRLINIGTEGILYAFEVKKLLDGELPAITFIFLPLYEGFYIVVSYEQPKSAEETTLILNEALVYFSDKYVEISIAERNSCAYPN